jgi:hypothetical protein
MKTFVSIFKQKVFKSQIKRFKINLLILEFLDTSFSGSNRKMDEKIEEIINQALVIAHLNSLWFLFL